MELDVESTHAIAYGKMQAEVSQLKTDVAELKQDVRELLELANRSKGSLWAGMTIASMFGALVSVILSHWPFK